MGRTSTSPGPCLPEDPEVKRLTELASATLDSLTTMCEEVMTFSPPAETPSQDQQSLTQAVPKAESILNRVVMSSTGERCGRWKQAPQKELMALLKIAWKEPIAEMRAKNFAARKKVVTQLLVYGLKPMAADKRAAGYTGEKYETTDLLTRAESRRFSKLETFSSAELHHECRCTPSPSVLGRARDSEQCACQL